MPYRLQYIPAKSCYSVREKQTTVKNRLEKSPKIYSKCTTRKKANSQIRLLRAIKNNPNFLSRKGQNKKGGGKRSKKHGKGKSWNDVLQDWENGIPFRYPTRMKKQKSGFQWNTSVLMKNGKSSFREKFRTNTDLPDTQTYTAFQEHLVDSKKMDAISFENPSKDTMLVIPVPKRGHNYATLKHFVDTAPMEQQIAFWKEVAKVARDQMAIHGKIWISAHGLGVPYLHIRVSTTPKYYFVRDFV